jgi:hypothetical protein
MFGSMFRRRDNAKLGSKPGILRLKHEPNGSDGRKLYNGEVIF